MLDKRRTHESQKRHNKYFLFTHCRKEPENSCSCNGFRVILTVALSAVFLKSHNKTFWTRNSSFTSFLIVQTSRCTNIFKSYIYLPFSRALYTRAKFHSLHSDGGIFENEHASVLELLSSLFILFEPWFTIVLYSFWLFRSVELSFPRKMNSAWSDRVLNRCTEQAFGRKRHLGYAQVMLKHK